MDTAHGKLFVYERSPASTERFVAFWADRYKYPDERLYTDNIEGPHTPETLRELFKWKIGVRFADTHLPVVERHFISRLELARQQPADVSAAEFLRAFPSGGPIYRIYWIHCWQPARFPIYDQHVHRAMTFLLDGTREELEDYSDREVLRLYAERYLPFWASFAGIDARKLDMAMWAFGKFIKRPPLPIE